jgi:hypothetical protein
MFESVRMKERTNDISKFLTCFIIAWDGANAARLMSLNNSDKNLATFLSARERVMLDDDQPWAMCSLNQTSVAIRCHLHQHLAKQREE